MFITPRLRLAMRQVFARTKVGFQLHGGKLFLGGGILLGVGILSPVMARSFRTRDTFNASRALVPREKAESSWSLTTKISNVTMLLRIFSLMWAFFPVLIASPLLLLDNEEATKWLYKFLRNRLAIAGPYFIKLGQWASTRYDLLPLALCDELNMLTQSAPFHSWEHTDQLLRSEFKGDYARCLNIEKDPVASGSIAQTYKGTLGDREVAIKVMHPNIETVMETDVSLVDGAFTAYDHIFGTSHREIFRAFAVHLHEQLDFRWEKRNLEQFDKNFKYWKFVTFPKPLTASKKVLVETFEHGHSIIEYIRANQNDSPPQDLITPEAQKKLCSIGLAALLKMIISDNFVHADLHPGNVFVRPIPKPDNVFAAIMQGIQAKYLGFSLQWDDMPQVCFLDAGLISAVDPANKKGVEEFFKSMLCHDGGKLAEAILNLSTQQGRTNPPDVAKHFIEEMQSKTSKWNASAWSLDQRTGECMKDALEIVRIHGIRLDTTVMVPFISAITLEGWQYELDPSVSVLDHIRLQMDRHEFMLNLTTRIAHSMWKSAEANVGIDEVYPPSFHLTEALTSLPGPQINPDSIR